jgi:hypothetical protein
VLSRIDAPARARRSQLEQTARVGSVSSVEPRGLNCARSDERAGTSPSEPARSPRSARARQVRCRLPTSCHGHRRRSKRLGPDRGFHCDACGQAPDARPADDPLPPQHNRNDDDEPPASMRATPIASTSDGPCRPLSEKSRWPVSGSATTMTPPAISGIPTRSARGIAKGMSRPGRCSRSDELDRRGEPRHGIFVGPLEPISSRPSSFAREW